MSDLKTRSPKNKDPLTKISELCAAQLMIVQTTGERPCRDEFLALVKVIEGWAKQAKGQVSTK